MTCKTARIWGKLLCLASNGLKFLLFVEQIVDFCCGSNDFSCLMKKKLDEVGKGCSYKNYDLFQPKVNYFPHLLSAYFRRRMPKN